MTWSVPLFPRPSTAFTLRGLWAAATAGRRRRRDPVTFRRSAGCLVIEVLREIGPAAEPALGRLPHAAIRPGCTAVVVDLRRAPRPGAGGTAMLRMARTLADRHGLTFALMNTGPTPPMALGARRQPTARQVGPARRETAVGRVGSAY